MLSKMLSTTKSKLSIYFQRYSIAKTRHLLLGLDDDLLERASISRELLQRGTDYWPWQIDDDNNPGSTGADYAVASKPELRSVSDEVSVAAGLEFDNAADASARPAEITTEKAA